MAVTTMTSISMPLILGQATLMLFQLWLARQLLFVPELSMVRRLWATGFIAAGMSWILLVAVLGLAQATGWWLVLQRGLWHLALQLAGIVSASILAAMVLGTTSAAWRRSGLGLVLVKFCGYSLWIHLSPALAYAVLDYIVAMVLVLLLLITPAARRQATAMRWLATGILVSFAALAVFSGDTLLGGGHGSTLLAQALALHV